MHGIVDDSDRKDSARRNDSKGIHQFMRTEKQVSEIKLPGGAFVGTEDPPKT